MPFDLDQADERRPRRVVDDAFEPAAIAALTDYFPPVCVLNDALPAEARSPALAVFVFGAAPCAYAHARFDLGQAAGAVFVPENDASADAVKPSIRDRSCVIYRVGTAGDALVVSCQYSIAPDRAFAWVESVLGAISPARLLVIDEQPWRGTRGEEEEAGPIHVLETSAHALLRAGSPLPAPPLTFMVDGPSAGLMAACEAEGKAALLLLVAKTADDSLYANMVGLEASLAAYARTPFAAQGGILGRVQRELGEEGACEALRSTAALLPRVRADCDMFA
mmetsp:Transcript_5159/g.13447  ORF Transcript_5159/g.13447 Transcript_5159/m.13447 type:complete len:279 (+) Transcript_5159:138-974(+)